MREKAVFFCSQQLNSIQAVFQSKGHFLKDSQPLFSLKIK